MKRTAALALVCVLLVTLLTGCSGDSAPAASEQTANFLPDATNFVGATTAPTDAPEEDSAILDTVDIPLDIVVEATEAPLANPFDNTTDQADEVSDEPEISELIGDDISAAESDETSIEPEESPEPTTAPGTPNYTYSELTDETFGFTLTYPSSWQNLPGKYTVCFREIVEEGDFPARIAITKKTLAHRPKAATVTKQFQEYGKIIYEQYDPDTFEFSELKTEGVTFMGKDAQEISYLAYSGDIEVEGYMVCCAIGYDLYVFHFSATYDDFALMQPIMTRIRDSIKPIEKED